MVFQSKAEMELQEVMSAHPELKAESEDIEIQ